MYSSFSPNLVDIEIKWFLLIIYETNLSKSLVPFGYIIQVLMQVNWKIVIHLQYATNLAVEMGLTR